ncbi:MULTISPECIES: hypothetical protein [Klebsiella/Raoultella group]|uniref:hypothetical protein n=1 Tax=Klebsiella/Raoultella group TaxID=2890311 RepID=UPI0015A5C709|nr:MULTISPECIES: hypothetical protein [Klebsiella/Raoultella group]
MPAIVQRHRAVVSLICLDRRDQGQNPDRRRSLLCQDARLFVSEKRYGQHTASVRQLDGQLQVRGAQGAQPARGFHAPAGGAQVRPVHRGVPTLLQHPLNIPRRHRPRTFRTEGGQHNQHPPLQRRRTSGFFPHHCPSFL